MQYGDKYHFLLSGDFNAHTGNRSDLQLIQIDEFVNTETGLEVIMDMFNDTAKYLTKNNVNTVRAPEDRSKDRYYGDTQLELCKNNGLCIFNGRIGRDAYIGKATTKFQTVVDYVIGSVPLAAVSCRFEVDNYDPLFSDAHCIIK